jgi:2-polyprenyl-6-methoxyphenol hydroxylase-like FAD-dependent oxidoreductase
MDAQVLIVGAGPTGLTLAIDLGRRGVRALVIEQKDAPQFLPKMERCNARTMEIYRRMGIVDQVRAAGLPAHCPMDIFVVLSLAEPALVHHVHPSVAEARAQITKSEDGSALAAAKIDRGDVAERHRALRVRARVVRAG